MKETGFFPKNPVPVALSFTVRKAVLNQTCCRIIGAGRCRGAGFGSENFQEVQGIP